MTEPKKFQKFLQRWLLRLLLLPLLLSLLNNCATVAAQITVTGKVAVKGNEPFTFLSIRNNDEEYQIVGKLEARIRQELQGRTATLRGTLLQDENSASALVPPKLEVSAILSVEGQVPEEENS